MICLEQEQRRFRAIAYNRGTKIQGNRYFLFFSHKRNDPHTRKITIHVVIEGDQLRV